MDSRCDMPEHLLFDILLWLPVTILLRFKSVCRSWYTLIDSSSFITQHFNHNSRDDNLLGVCLDDANEACYKSCLFSGNRYEVRNNFDYGQPWHFVEPVDVFSSNGIICLVEFTRQENVVMCNPAMKQLRSLPKSPTFGQEVYAFFGFGFNVKSNDHIFMRTVRTVCDKYTSNNVVEVYSLRADSWRTMHKELAIPFGFFGSNYQITKNGTCFWISYYGVDIYVYDDGRCDTDSNVILSFDLKEETYEMMPLPVGHVPFSAVIDFLDDKLAYIHGVEGDYINGHLYCEIWVLHEYGVKESWNKLWMIGPTDVEIPSWGSDILFPSSFTKNGEFLLFTTTAHLRKSGLLHLYNLGTEENEYLELKQPHMDFLWCVSYTESLVPVKRVNGAY